MTVCQMIPKKKNQAIENHIITVRLALMSLEMRENIIQKEDDNNDGGCG